MSTTSHSGRTWDSRRRPADRCRRADPADRDQQIASCWCTITAAARRPRTVKCVAVRSCSAGGVTERASDFSVLDSCFDSGSRVTPLPKRRQGSPRVRAAAPVGRRERPVGAQPGVNRCSPLAHHRPRPYGAGRGAGRATHLRKSDDACVELVRCNHAHRRAGGTGRAFSGRGSACSSARRQSAGETNAR